MSSDLLTGGMKAIIGSAFASIFRSATLERDVMSSTSTSSPDEDTPEWAPSVASTIVFTCKAIYETYSTYARANNLVQVNDRKVLVLAASLSTTPVIGDRMIIDGITFDVMDVVTDPANAVWEIQGRVGEA